MNKSHINLILSKSSEDEYVSILDLEAALKQSRDDIAADRYVIETPQEHVDGLIEELKKEA